ncbi:conserved membrane protein of unknown function [Tenacibaculum sp. 190524A02b]|uniref:hybrid sensor histidine kinase/response regulator transcription factor n=1 Tax=Tenacibaculum vairaonense TaxID=3137860 RepID=UPI0032B13312
MNFLQRFLLIGNYDRMPSKELKRIQFFNGFCLLWYVISTSLIIRRLFKKTIEYPTIIVHATMITLLIVAQYFLYKQRSIISYSIYVFCLIVTAFVFSNFIYPGRFTEFYYLLVTPVCLIFIDNKTLNYVVLFVSFLFFFIPNLFLENYPIHYYNDLVLVFLFFSVFIVINYFKVLNNKNEKRLEAKKNEVEQINQFQSQFFINISHEIRTPLTLIKGQIAKLENYENKIGGEDYKMIRLNLNKQVQKIKNMVDDVLDLAKMEDTNFNLHCKPIKINELINKIYISFIPLYDLKKIKFNYIHNHINSTIKVDPIFLERAINNIIINATKYTDENGEVTITLSEKNNMLFIAIKDTGIGISAKDLPNICNRFYQVNNDINRAGGSGVGLSFTKQVVDLHKGKLLINSVLGEGSVFTIRLPVSTEVAKYTFDENESFINKIPLQKSDTIKDISVKYKTILIVDDSYEMLDYLEEILSTTYNCITCSNGAEAIVKMNNHKVDYIITDYMMPKMNGLEFIKALKERKNNHPPILMLTAVGDRNTRLEVLRLGIDDYLQKPFEKEELLIRISNSLKNYLKQQNYIETEKISVIATEQDDLLKEIQIYIIKESSKRKITQLDIAEKFNLSKSSLYRRLKAETGLSPNDFIVEIKLNHARNILELQPNISLKRLSLEVGYSHVSYFSKIFKERFGFKPCK